MISQERLKHILSYSEDNGIFTWCNPTSNRVTIGNNAGSVRPDGYLKINLDNKPYMAHRLVWLYVYGEFPDHEIDHINGNRLDNRLVNLRDATSKQNKENAKLKCNNTSGYRGVSWDKSRNKWLANVVHFRKFINVGRYDTIEEAVMAVKNARDSYFTHHKTSYSL